MAVDPPRAPLRRRLRARALRALVRGAGLVPPPVAGAVLGSAARLAIAGSRGDLARRNLDAVFGAAGPGEARDRERLLRDAARFAGRQLAEWLRLARGAAPGTGEGAWIDELVALDDSIERLDRVLAEGRGAIVVTAHLGNWELLCARLRRRGVHGAVVGRVRRRDPSHAWLAEMRRAYGVETIAQDAPAREALAVLRGGGVLGLLPDLAVKRLQGIEVPFLGVPAWTMTAPAAFARAHRAPLVPIRCVAGGTERGRARGPYRLSVEAPLGLAPDLARADAARDLLARMNDVFGRWILEDPEQWAWHQPRFRSVSR